MTLGGAGKPIGFKKFDVVKVFENAKHTGGYQMGIIFSQKMKVKNVKNHKYIVQFEYGDQEDVEENKLEVVKRFKNQDIREKRNKVIRYTLLVAKTLQEFGPPRNSEGEKKIIPDYDGKIRFSVFADQPLNEEINNLIACNQSHRQEGDCPFGRDALIDSPVTDADILRAYNDAAPLRNSDTSRHSSRSSSRSSSSNSSNSSSNNNNSGSGSSSNNKRSSNSRSNSSRSRRSNRSSRSSRSSRSKRSSRRSRRRRSRSCCSSF